MGDGDAFALDQTFIHLGLGVRALPLPGFSFTPDYLARYTEMSDSDGDEGRLVCIVLPGRHVRDSWERHPAGEEVVFLMSGRVDLVQEIDGGEHVVELHAGEAAINPPNVWHTARVHEPGRALFITPGRGTEHKPLQ